MGKNDDLFEVDFGGSGVTLMEQSGVTQTDTKTVDDKPPVEQTPKSTKDGFELVENLLDDSGEEPEGNEEVVEETKETKKTPPSANDTDDASDSFAFVFAENQQEEGNLSFELNTEEFKKLIEEQGEAAAITWLWNKEKEHVQNSIKEMYDADAKELMDLKDAGVDSDTARELVGAKIKFEGITPEQLEEKEDLRRQILTQDFKNTSNLSDERIKKMVDSIVATGDDVDEAKKALESVKKFNVDQIKAEKLRVENEEKAQAEQAKASKEALIKKIDETKEILPGYEVSKQVKKDIEKMITEPAAKTKDGRVLNGVWAKFQENPEESLIKLAFLMKSGIWDGKIDKLEKVAKTSAAKKMEEVIKSKGGSIGNKGKGTASANDDDTMQSMKSVFPI